jgi:hypothetical protein
MEIPVRPVDCEGRVTTLYARGAFLTGLLINLPVSPRTHNPIRTLRQVRRPDHTITTVQFDYAGGTAYRVVTDERNGKVLQFQKYPGRPQSSRQEFQEAVFIISYDSALASLVAGGAVTEGGFIVDGPSGHPVNDRYIQIRLLSRDRRRLLRVALVDLTLAQSCSRRLTKVSLNNVP